MAIVATAVVNNPTYKSWTLTALDADTTLAITHNFGSAPDVAFVQPYISSATAGVIAWGVVVSATQITLTKQTTATSGGTTPGTTVIGKLVAMLPHSIM